MQDAPPPPKRSRGRPPVEKIKDGPMLAAVADMLLANPGMTRSAAAKRVLKGISENQIHRLLAKWRKRGGDALMTEAALRAQQRVEVTAKARRDGKMQIPPDILAGTFPRLPPMPEDMRALMSARLPPAPEYAKALMPQTLAESSRAAAEKWGSPELMRATPPASFIEQHMEAAQRRSEFLREPVVPEWQKYTDDARRRAEMGFMPSPFGPERKKR